MSVSFSPENLDKLCTDVQQIALEAGEAILTVYAKDFAVEYKADTSPLTEADRAAHQCITKQLSELTPTIPILSEEGILADVETRKAWSAYWLIDPLDGTKEFVKRSGEFTVNIALIRQHTPVLGVVYAPVTKTLFFASKGNGAWVTRAATPSPIFAKQSLDPKSINIAGSRSHGTAKLDDFVATFPHASVKSMGSSLKICMVAEGAADIYPRFGPTSEWDTAAAHCVVNEAGGLLVDLNMQPLQYNRKDSVINPDFLVIGDKHYPWDTHLERTQEPHADDRNKLDFG